MNKIKLAILASGSGTNAENIAKYFKEHSTIDVALIASNKSDAYVLERAKKLKIPSVTFTGKELKEGKLTDILEKGGVSYIVLAGFLLKIPEDLISFLPEKIINIHPALLPAYGGKGMFGEKVHKAVVENGEKFSGISIHLVNENYDEGRILFQAMCPVAESDTPDSLAEKIHSLEYEYFPKIIEDYIVEKEGLVNKND